MRARLLLPGGESRDVTGRTVESIARTAFGRDAGVTQEHSDALEPTWIRWTVTRHTPGDSAREVLGHIVTYPTRDRSGRPQKHGEPMVRFPLRLPVSVHAEVTATAAQVGHSVNDEIVTRVARPSTPTTPEEGSPDA